METYRHGQINYGVLLGITEISMMAYYSQNQIITIPYASNILYIQKPCRRRYFLKFDVELSLASSMSDNFLHTNIVLINRYSQVLI